MMMMLMIIIMMLTMVFMVQDEVVNKDLPKSQANMTADCSNLTLVLSANTDEDI